jgi:hypothetical protein
MSPLLLIDLARAIDADRRREARRHAVENGTGERSGR